MTITPTASGGAEPRRAFRLASLRWPAITTFYTVAALGIYANRVTNRGIEGAVGGFPFGWAWLGIDGAMHYDVVSMAVDAAFYLVLAVCSALQIEHWSNARPLRVRFSMRAIFLGVAILAVLCRAAPTSGIQITLAGTARTVTIVFGLFSAATAVLRWLDRVAKQWSEPED